MNAVTNAVVLGQGYTAVSWNLDTNDWKVRNTARIVQNLKDGMAELSGQSIIELTHDTYLETANAVPEMIAALKGAGYQLVTVAECNGDPNGAYR
jgi:peptidoglycan/xylan/chitin deacetylase (PgdA/CDA1 family)